MSSPLGQLLARHKIRRADKAPGTILPRLPIRNRERPQPVDKVVLTLVVAPGEPDPQQLSGCDLS